MQALPRNNQVIEFRQAEEIASHLREQWAGLFQRFLQQQEQIIDRRAADDLHEALKTVNQLVTFLADERRQQGGYVNEILLTNHPIFARIRKLTNTTFPVFFRTLEELSAFLKAKRWSEVVDDTWSYPKSDWYEWEKTDPSQSRYEQLIVSHNIFEDGTLGNSGDIRPVGDGVSELPIHYRPGYRIYLTK